jgi:hypothetical protein
MLQKHMSDGVTSYRDPPESQRPWAKESPAVVARVLAEEERRE